jgi:GTP:adenosylcobinamide-phosphate guanylyltransferase
MIAIITAGGEALPGKPLYELTHGGLKAMLEIAGKPMVQWVLDALSETSGIDQVIVVGLPLETDLVCAHPLILLPNHGDMLSNIQAGAEKALEINPNATHAILCSSDIPAIRPDIIEWLMDQAKDLDQDIYYTVIERAVMEELFPSSKRTYTHLKDLQVCGGDVHCFRLGAAVEDNPFWKRLIDARKSPVRQASLLGYDTLFFLMLGQLRLKDAEETVCKRLGIQGRAILCPYAEVGMDVDKLFQFEIMSEYLAKPHEGKLAGSTQV